MRLFFALFGGLVQFLVIGKRMRIGADDVCVNQGRAAALAYVFDGFFADSIALERISAVELGNMQARKIADQFRDIATSGLYFNGYRNGVAVVFDEIEQRQFLGAGSVERFPELAFTGGTVACGDVDD